MINYYNYVKVVLSSFKMKRSLSTRILEYSFTMKLQSAISFRSIYRIGIISWKKLDCFSGFIFVRRRSCFDCLENSTVSKTLTSIEAGNENHKEEEHHIANLSGLHLTAHKIEDNLR